MSALPSHDELRIIKLYRVFCTIASMAVDRGFTIKKPEIMRNINDNPEYVIDFPTFRKLFVTTEACDAPGGGENVAGVATATLVEKANREAMRFQCKPRKIDTPGASSSTAVDKTDDGQTDKGGLMVFFSPEEHITANGVLHIRAKAVKKMGTGSAVVIVCQNKVFPSVRREIEELSGRLDETTGERLLSIQLVEEDDFTFNPTRHDTVPKHRPLQQAEAEAFLKSRSLQAAQLPRIRKEDPISQYFGLERGQIVCIDRPCDYSDSYEMYRVVT